MPITNFDELFTALSDVITTSENNIHSHLEGLQSSFTGSFEGIESNLGGLSSSLTAQSQGIISTIDGVHQHLTQQDDSIVTLSSSVSSIDLSSINLSAFSFLSLNGSNGSIPDNQNVTVTKHDGIFKVVSSQMLKNDDVQYLIIYLLEKNGSKFIVPSNMVTISTSV